MHSIEKIKPLVITLSSNIVDMTLEMDIKNIILTNIAYYTKFDKNLINLTRGIQSDLMNHDKSDLNCKY